MGAGGKWGGGGGGVITINDMKYDIDDMIKYYKKSDDSNNNNNPALEHMKNVLMTEYSIEDGVLYHDSNKYLRVDTKTRIRNLKNKKLYAGNTFGDPADGIHHSPYTIYNNYKRPVTVEVIGLTYDFSVDMFGHNTIEDVRKEIKKRNEFGVKTGFTFKKEYDGDTLDNTTVLNKLTNGETKITLIIENYYKNVNELEHSIY